MDIAYGYLRSRVLDFKVDQQTYGSVLYASNTVLAKPLNVECPAPFKGFLQQLDSVGRVLLQDSKTKFRHQVFCPVTLAKLLKVGHRHTRIILSVDGHLGLLDHSIET